MTVPLLLLCAAAAAAEWTVGIYMAADNGMAAQSYADLAELERVGSSHAVNVVVQVDRPFNDSLPGCRRYLVGRGGSTQLAELGQVDMADPATFGSFARFVGERFPARNYLLVMWDHGNGWTAADPPPSHRSVFIDGSAGSTMSVAGGELGRALEQARAELGKRIRVFGFDACFMGMVEVAAEAERWCDYFVAAEGLAPLGGWPYDRLVELVQANADRDPREWLPALCSAYVAQYPGEDVDIAATDLRRLGAAFDRLATRVGRYSSADSSGWFAARNSAQTFSENGMRPPCAADDQVDLIDFLERAHADAGLLSALGAAVVARSAQGAVAGARGLAGWFPDRYLELKNGAAAYGGLRFAQLVPWREFLNAFHGRDDVRPPAPQPSRVDARDNTVRLWWSKSDDLAPVRYRVLECGTLDTLAADGCESLDGWSGSGWSVSADDPHSGAGCFRTAAGAGRRDTLTWTGTVAGGRLLQFFARYSTEEVEDSTGIRHDAGYVDVRENGEWRCLDSLHGRQDSWARHRYAVDGEFTGLRFRWVSLGPNSGGVRLDDIRIEGGAEPFAALTPWLADTAALLWDLPQSPDGYRLFVVARDSFGNCSMLSDPAATGPMLDYAAPCAAPNPFSDSCRIIIDGPGGEYDITIFTLSGRRVRRFAAVDSPVSWDGRNEAGRPVADGIYLVVAQRAGFRIIGRIARVAGAGR